MSVWLLLAREEMHGGAAVGVVLMSVAMSEAFVFSYIYKRQKKKMKEVEAKNNILAMQVLSPLVQATEPLDPKLVNALRSVH